MDKPVVSVMCFAYNHEKYIRHCLESLVVQKTDFPFEVIVHDDASEDGTKEIISELADKYSDIIVPIFQKSNQYQQGAELFQLIEPYVRGKYVAICEGDDYWSSPDKLQKQYESMKNHSECGLCVHRTLEVTEEEKETGIAYPGQAYASGILDENEFFASFEPRTFHTTSYFFRADYWREYLKNPPTYKICAVVGDDPLLLYFGSHYPIFYIDEVLSCYRRGAESSWSNSLNGVDEQRLIRYYAGQENTFTNFDRTTGLKFHRSMVKRISKFLYGRCALSADFHDFFHGSRDCLIELPFLKRLTVYLGILCPRMVKRIFLCHLRLQARKERNRWKGK